MEICISLGLGQLKPIPGIFMKPNYIGMGISFGLVNGPEIPFY